MTTDNDALEPTPRTWPENAWPTAAELADWLSRCTSEERLDYADRSLTTAQHAARCFEQGHADLLEKIDGLRGRLARVSELAEEWAEEGSDLVRNCYSGQDVFEGEQMQRCATTLRAALGGDQEAGT